MIYAVTPLQTVKYIYTLIIDCTLFLWIVGGGGGGDGGRCKAEVVVECGLGAEAENEDEGGAVRVDARDGGEVEDACAVGGVEVGEVGATAGWGADGNYYPPLHCEIYCFLLWRHGC